MALQDSDNFIVGRGDESYKITYQDLKDDLNYVPPPVGTIDKPTVLGPKDGAGSGVTRDIVTDPITDVEGGGVITCETELIQSVSSSSLTSSAQIFAETNRVSVNNATWDVSVGTKNPEISWGTNQQADKYMFKLVFNEAVELALILNKPAAQYGTRRIRFFTSEDGVSWEFAGSTQFDSSDPQGTKIQLPSAVYSKYWAFLKGNTTDPDAIPPDGNQMMVYDWQFWIPSVPSTLTFPSAQGFDCFKPGDVVQSDWNQSQVWSESFDCPQGFPYNPKETLFNGSLSDGVFIGTTNATGTFTGTLTTSIPCTSLEVYVLSNGSKVSGAGSANDGTEATFTGTGWYPIEPPADGVLTKLELKRIATGTDNNGLDYAAIKVNGKLLVNTGITDTTEVKVISKDDSDPFTIIVDGGTWTTSDKLTKDVPYNTKLTLAGAKDLDVLQVGDVVKMGPDADVPYQPVSDSIVSVGDESAWNQSQVWSNLWSLTEGSYSGGTIDQLHNGTTAEAIAPLSDQAIMSATFSVAGSVVVTMGKESSGDGRITIDVGNGPVDITPAANTAQEDSAPFVSTGSFTVTCQRLGFSGTAYLKMISVNGKPLVDTGIAGAPTTGNTTLTLSGDTDLAYFREGDVVQSEGAALPTADNPAGFDPSYPAANLVDDDNTNVSKLATANSSDYQYSIYVDITGALGNDFKDRLYAFKLDSASMVDVDYAEVIYEDGSSSGLVSVGWLSTYTEINNPPDPNKAIRSVRLTSKSGGIPGGQIGGIYINDGSYQLLTGGIEVKIVSIDESVPSITVDGGEWDTSNQSQVWSSNNTDYDSSKPASSSFNGDTRSSSGFSMPPSKGTSCRVTFDPIPASKIEVYHLLQSGAPGISFDYYISDSQQRTVRDNNPEGWATLYDGAEITINGLGATGSNVGSSGGIGGGHTAWRIDGKLLVDTGVRDFGDSQVTCQSPLKAPTDWTIEAIDTTANTLSLSHAAEDNSQVWVANDNQAGIDFYVTGPSIVDEPLLTADVELESSDFATTPVDSDTLKNIVWELNGVEQNAGTMNPYKPTLNTGTTYTVRVKHEGNTLEDSPWSDQTTFTTGASRNLYEYQRSQIQSLTTRIGGLEANDVTDDATDTALLTLLSNLAIRVQALEESN